MGSKTSQQEPKMPQRNEYFLSTTLQQRVENIYENNIVAEAFFHKCNIKDK